MKPEFIIIGDSHTKALKDGFDALGIPTELVQHSGDTYHRNMIRMNHHGAFFSKKKYIMKQFSATAEKLGMDSLADGTIPVVASIGYHLGRLIPPLWWNDHVLYNDDAKMKPGQMVMSQGFLETYIEQSRVGQFRLIKRMSMRTDLTIITPPPLDDRHAMKVATKYINDRVKSLNVNVYDARQDFCQDGRVFPEELIDADGVHGSKRYGQMLVENLLEQGFIKRR